MYKKNDEKRELILFKQGLCIKARMEIYKNYTPEYLRLYSYYSKRIQEFDAELIQLNELDKDR